MRIAIVLLLVAATPAFADPDDDCDITAVSGGSWANYLAEQFDNCEVNNTCILAPGDIPPPPRAEHGFFLTLGGAVGAQGRVQDRDASSGGRFVASGSMGWKAGFRTCGSADIVAGNESSADLREAIAWPWAFMGISLSSEQQIDVRPKLDAGRIWLRRPYASEVISPQMAVAQWRRTNGGTSSVIPFRYALRTTSQDQFHSVFTNWALSMYEHHAPGYAFEVMPIKLEAKYPDGLGTDQRPKPASTTLATVGIANVDFTTHGVRYVGGIGFTGAGGVTDRICGGCAPVVGNASATFEAFDGSLTLGGERSAHLAMDDVITVENRLSADYVRDSKHHAIRAAAFAAITRTSADNKPQLTGGSSVGLDLKLPEKIVAALDVAVARSYYGQLDGDATPTTPQLAGLGTVNLQRKFNWTAR